MGLIVVLAAGLVVAITGFKPLWTGILDQRVIVPGDTAPDFRVLTTRGRTMTPQDFPGKVLVLNFWASWCPPCIEEAPSLNAFADQMGPKGVVVLGISIDRNETSYKKFLSKYGVNFDTWDDPDANVSTDYGTFQIPETYIIDKSGKVVEKIISNQNFMDPEFLAHIEKML